MYCFFLRSLSCHVLFLVFVSFVLLVSRPRFQCLGFASMPPDGNSNAECRQADIQLYTWTGPGFDSGECWYQGHRFVNGAIWGRNDVQAAPYCVCEEGQIRIFYSQSKPKKPAIPEPLTLLPTIHSSLPTSNDLAKWPIPNVLITSQRRIICSTNQLGKRIQSRDRCSRCKCSTNGHWLCRKSSSSKKNDILNTQRKFSQQQQQTSR